ncbi:MAG: hypothetical protein GYB65_23070 [Chloroflexi bacterium]|nr:hypothetical protein [Chloroflexota bacterium]
MLHKRFFPAVVILALVLAPVLALPLTTFAQNGGLPLTEHFQTVDGLYSFNYPAEWAVSANGPLITLASSEDALAAGSDIGSGQMRAALFVAHITDPPLNLSPDATVYDAMEGILAIQDVPTCQPFTAPQLAPFSGRTIIYATQNCSLRDNISVIIQLDDGYIGFVAGTTYRNEMSDYEATLLNVAESFRLGGPEESTPTNQSSALTADMSLVAASITAEDGSFSFRYPPDWLAEEGGNLLFGITDGPESFWPTPPPDQLAILLSIFRPDDIPPAFQVTPASMVLWLGEEGLSGFMFSEPESFILNGRDAARTELDTTMLDVVYLAIRLDGGGYGTIQALAGPGELAAIEPRLYAMLASIAYGTTPAGDVGSTGQPDTNVLPDSDSMPGASNIFTSPNGDYEFSVPENWVIGTEVVEGYELVVMTTDGNFVLGPPAPGRPYVLFERSSISRLTDQAPLLDGRDPVRALEYLNANTDTTFGTVLPMTIGDSAAATTTSSLDGFDNTAVLMMLNEDAYIYANVAAAPGEMDAVLEVVQEVMLSARLAGDGVEVSALALDVPLTQTYTAPDGSFSLNFPAGWTLDNGEGLPVLVGSIASPNDTRILVSLSSQPGQTLDAQLASSLATLGSGMVSDGIFHFTVNGRPGARIGVVSTLLPGMGLTTVRLDMGNDQFFSMLIALAPFDHPDFYPTLYAILGTVQVAP